VDQEAGSINLKEQIHDINTHYIFRPYSLPDGSVSLYVNYIWKW